MSHKVKCDFCGTRGRRRMGRVAPEGWLYLEATDEDEGPSGTLIVYACSVVCALDQWKMGPGTLSLKTEEATMGAEMLEDNEKPKKRCGNCLACTRGERCQNKVKLEPPDLKRCQAEVTTTLGFMVMGGPPKKTERCEKPSQFVAVEKTPGADGQRGAMGLCLDCSVVFKRLMPGIADLLTVGAYVDSLKPPPPPKPTWQLMEQAVCDMCPAVAIWRHPEGGLRCDMCPRPEE